MADSGFFSQSLCQGKPDVEFYHYVWHSDCVPLRFVADTAFSKLKTVLPLAPHCCSQWGLKY